MKMKIPVPETSTTNMYNIHDNSVDYLGSDNTENSQQEENETPPAENDFSEYLWMENEEEFDKQIMQQLEEEALMEHCLEVMMDHEHALGNVPYPYMPPGRDNDEELSWSTAQPQNGSDLCRQMSNLRVEENVDELAKQSTLNPDAAEFVPQSRTVVEVEKTS